MFMIYNPERNHPRVVHNTMSEANSEAMRLARLHPGQRFYILSAQGYFSTPQPQPVYTDITMERAVNNLRRFVDTGSLGLVDRAESSARTYPPMNGPYPGYIHSGWTTEPAPEEAPVMTYDGGTTDGGAAGITINMPDALLRSLVDN